MRPGPARRAAAGSLQQVGRSGAGPDAASLPPDVRQAHAAFAAALDAGYPPEEVARQVAEAIRARRFYVLPAQPWLVDLVRQRMTDVIEQRNPTPMPFG